MQISWWGLVAWGCVAIAGCFVMTGVETMGSVEYLLKQENGRFSYLVAGGAAVTVLAPLLPCFAGKLWRIGHRFLPVAAWCAVPFALAVTLLAAIERTGTARDTAVQRIEGHNHNVAEARDAVRDAKEAWRTASNDVRTECKSGDGPRCRSAKTVLGEKAEALKTAREAVSTLVRNRPIDSQARRVAAMFPWISETQVQLYQPILLPMTIAVLSILLMALGEPLVAAGLKARRERQAQLATAAQHTVATEIIAPVSEPKAAELRAEAEERPAASNVVRLVTDQSNTGRVSKFLVACAKTARGAAAELNALYEAYLGWCDREGLRPISPAQFLEELKAICDHAGFDVRRRGSQVQIVGLKLAA